MRSDINSVPFVAATTFTGQVATDVSYLCVWGA
jgi:hypothetical protein